LNEFISNFRYDYPIPFKTVVAIFSFVFLLLLFMAIPNAPLMNVIGVTAGQKKVNALYFATFWSVRSYMHDAATAQKEKSLFGSMIGVDVNGNLIISIPVGEKFEQYSVRIADAKLVDLYGVAAMVGTLRTESAIFDFYPNNEVVVWIRGTPFNVKLIESGFAVPEPTPPTIIVDRAFATYYWRIFNGTEK